MKKKILLLAVLFFIVHCILKIENCFCQWSVQTFPFNGVIYGIAFKDVNNGVACGHTFTNFSEMLYYTTNSGTNWILASYPPTLRSLPSVQYINATTIYASGAENITLSGQTKYYSPDFQKLPPYLKSHFLRLGIDGSYNTYKGAFVKSTDAGVTWSKVSTFDTTTGYLVDINFLNANTGYACADSGNLGNSSVLKTTNGGINWVKINLEQEINLYRVFFLDINTGFACGFKMVATSGGFIFKTTNGGVNWTKKSFLYPEQNEIKDICFFNATTGIAINSCEADVLKIFKSTNTGITWDSVTTFENILPESINFVNGTGTALITGYIDSALQYANYTFKTTDYGSTWVRKRINTSNAMIIQSSLVDQNNWFIGGGDFLNPAIVLKSTNGGNVFVNTIGSEIPTNYSLHQNYPNPFNPSTKIQFDIPSEVKRKTLDVKLLIYDILGKEVVTLVNEKLQPGTYEVNFNASNLSSGVYFYKLTAGSFTDTKKMLMIK
jgi:photosystem II stability/assembly factor-like uncharacterized protein